VSAAIHRQLRTLNTNTRYLHDTIWQFAERLAATLPDPLRVCYFVNSGSEASELALRLARAHTGARDLVVLDAAYHGNTTTLIDISPYKFNGPGGQGAPDWVHVAPIPDDYRGEYRRDDPEAARKYGEAVGRLVRDVQSRGRRLSAFICESCPSVGGQIVPPAGYLETAYGHVRAAGGVCIADEVQTAYGRMGDTLYAFEAQSVIPDIVVLGKPIGNGYPLGAVVTTAEIAASFDNGMEFFSTFGGSTVSCAAGLATLEAVLDEDLQAHAHRVGGHLLNGLRDLAARHEIIGDVRGRGFFLGVELVKDRASREPATADANRIVNAMRERGILLGTDGPSHNVLKIRPPMPFGADDADFLVGRLADVLSGR
jgi:4-aminobutyrate aminotransferase-like enzyme